MGDTFQDIVVPTARLDDAAWFADDVLKFLIENEIILPQRTDCILGGKGGYPPGKRFEEAVVQPSNDVRRLRTNGMDVVIGRTVFHNGGLGVDAVLCPACGANQVDGDWADAVDRWYAGDDDAPLACGACRAEIPLTRWVFGPPWGFASLGFKFWNWPPLKLEFVDRVSKVLQTQRDAGSRKVVITFTHRNRCLERLPEQRAHRCSTTITLAISTRVIRPT